MTRLLGDPAIASAEPAHSDETRRRRAVVVTGITAVAVTAVFGGVTWHRAGSPVAHAVTPAVSTSFDGADVDLSSLAQQEIQQQQSALAAGDRTAFLEGWIEQGASQHRATEVFHNLTALRARVDLHVEGSDPVVTIENRTERGWTAEVDVGWRLPRFDQADATTTLTYTFRLADDAAKIIDVDVAPGSREPIWLEDRLAIRRTAHTLVAVAGARRDARELSRRLQIASDDVSQVIGHFSGGLVVFVPANAVRLEAVLGAAPGDYDDIAAVTAAIGGANTVNAPVAIVINPDVYPRLRPLGRHVVLTHEATHLATGAATVRMPAWVAEGFADYVGVGSVGVTTAVSAGALVQHITQHGLPEELPGNDDFFDRSHDTEVVYESSWMAMRSIARQVGERRLVGFYQAVVAHPRSTDTALSRYVGLSPAAFTQVWRSDLRKLADAR